MVTMVTLSAQDASGAEFEEKEYKYYIESVSSVLLLAISYSSPHVARPHSAQRETVCVERGLAM